jgi:tripartite-type tricarboxylate transporter receptor subunit TctC
MRQKNICLSIILITVFVFASQKALLAAPFYEGKVITLICGAEPGGGQDTTARLIAKHLPKHIPGKPTIVVQNMSGAIGVIAANHLYNIVKPNGLTIGNFNRGLSFGQLQKAQGIRFDLTKFSWIGSPTVEATVLIVRNDFPYKTFEDLRNAKEQLNVGCTGTTGIDYSFLLLFQEFTGIKFNIVMYPGGSATMLAIERKEVDIRVASYSSIKPYIKRGLVRPLVRGQVSEPGIEDLPVDEDLVTDKKGKILLAMRSMPDRIGRPFVAPPGTSADIMKILRDAFAKVTQDSEFKKDAEKFMMTAEYVPAEKCLDTLNFLFNQPPDIVNEFNKYTRF